MIINYWEGNARVYHHTAPINMMYALYQGLVNIIDEGYDNVISRHKSAHEYLVSELTQLDINFLVDKPYRIPSLNSVIIPKPIASPLSAIPGPLLAVTASFPTNAAPRALVTAAISSSA